MLGAGLHEIAKAPAINIKNKQEQIFINENFGM
jgi:hypothetical protein